ncbi:MAG: uroporphyrinogen decarboxylase, partial [Neisseriaceae bacterium]|nr:uroporphyrinogen decarboxylase [Neisseriaceae bacterium]
GLDWTVNIKDARRRVGDKVALQGKFDPFALFGTKQSIEAEVGRILADYGRGSGHIFNLGHGIHQLTDPERVKDLVNAVHELSRAYH